jgi:hypothetical protein
MRHSFLQLFLEATAEQPVPGSAALSLKLCHQMAPLRKFGGEQGSTLMLFDPAEGPSPKL